MNSSRPHREACFEAAKKRWERFSFQPLLVLSFSSTRYFHLFCPFLFSHHLSLSLSLLLPSIAHSSWASCTRHPREGKTKEIHKNLIFFIWGAINHHQKQLHGSNEISISPHSSGFLFFSCFCNRGLQCEAQVYGTRAVSQRFQGPRCASP